MMVRRIGSWAVSEVMAEMTAQMLMHRIYVLHVRYGADACNPSANLCFVQILHVDPQLVATVEVFGPLLLDKRQVPLREKG